MVVIMAVFCCQPVWAQGDTAVDKKSKSGAHIGDITITATKMATTVDNIPTNIAVISREKLEQYPGHYNALTVLRDMNIPGMYFVGTDRGSTSGDISMSSRGGEVSNWAMKVMINGIEFNPGIGYVRSGSLAIHDIERIEITKTPSAEYGDQAIGGVINIITRTANKPVEASAGLAFSSLGGGNGYSVINGVKEKWQYYIDASAVREDAYQDGGYLHGDNVYAMTRYAVSDDADISLHGSFRDSKGNFTQALTRQQFEEDPSQNPITGADYHNETEGILGALVYTQQLGPHTLMAKAEMEDTNFQLYWGAYVDQEGWQAHPEVNVTLNHDIAGMVNKLVVGGEYRYHDMTAKRYMATSFYDIGEINRDFSRKDISYAGYLQDELCMTDRLTVSAGLRYDYFDLEQVANIASSDSWDQAKGDVSPKIGFTYQASKAVNLFAGLNSGIKSPVRLPMWYTNGELDPERLWAYEAGLRGNISSWLDYNVALFWQDVTDKFVRSGSDLSAQYENAGETTAKGVEVGANARLPHGFYASTSFTWQQSEFDEFVSRGVDYSGNKLTGVPDIMFAFKLGFRDEMLGDISLNPVYTGKRYFNYANTTEEDGFWILNARYAKQIGAAELYLVANNVFGEDAVGSGSGNPGDESLYPLPGFNAIFGLNVRF
ncbi:TonB-dependent receptor [Desulfosarcina variabilis str. Montpellier]